MSARWKEYCLKQKIDSYAHWFDHPSPEDAAAPAADGFAIARLVVPPGLTDQRALNLLDLLGLPERQGSPEPGEYVLSAPTARLRDGDLVDAFRDAGGYVEQCAASVPGTYLQLRDVQPPHADLIPTVRPDSVITAIIDDGIGFANARFRDGPLASRIAFFWDQNPRHKPLTRQSGLELTGVQIDRLLRDHSSDGLVDEEAIYRASGIVDFAAADENPTALGRSHGTHVLDLAAGCDPDDRAEAGLRARNPIIAVQLPPQIVARTNGLGTACYARLAIDYIVERARLLSRKAGLSGTLPVVINFSFGDIAGRHDGMDPFEIYVDKLWDPDASGDRPVKAVILPAGNSFLARSHAVAKTDDVIADGRDLTFRIQPGNKAATFVQVWLPVLPPPDAPDPGGAGQAMPHPHDRLDVQLTPPIGKQSPHTHRLPPDSFLEYAADGQLIARIYRQIDDPAPLVAESGYARLKITIAIQPTEADDPDQPVAPSGLWTLRLIDRGLACGGMIDAWIERGDTPTGYRAKGRQSYFEDACYRRHVRPDITPGRPAGDPEEHEQPASFIRRAGTLNPIATGRRSTAVGAFRSSDREAAFYSSSGPIQEFDGRQPDPEVVCERPDLATVGEDSRIRGNRLASGTLSGSINAQRGTSVAAPMAARKAVEILMRPCGSNVRKELRASAAASESEHKTSDPPEHSNRIGAGRLSYDTQRTPPRRETT